MKKVLFILLLLVASLAVIPLFLPKVMHVEQEYVYDVPTAQVYDYFNNMEKFTQFDAWSESDPNIKIDYSSPTYGEGAYYKWNSENKNLGKGKMQIGEAKKDEFISYDLVFGEMKGNTADVIFQKLDEGKTKVIWSFDSGEANYPFQVFNVLMKGTVQRNLKKGMENLDSLLQKSSKINLENTDIHRGGFKVVEEPTKKLFGVLQQTSTSDEEMGTAMAETFGLVYSYLKDANGFTTQEIGKPVVYWKQYSEEQNSALFYCGYLVSKSATEKDEMENVEIPTGKYLTTIHNGAYNSLGITYSRLFKFVEMKNLSFSKETLDVYLNSPEHVNEKELKTQIFMPIVE